MLTKEELKGLLEVLNYYIIGGLMLGIVCSTVAGNGGIVLLRNYGLPVSPQLMTALIVMLLGLLTGLMAYVVLLPAELKLVRRKLKPKILARRLSRRK